MAWPSSSRPTIGAGAPAAILAACAALSLGGVCPARAASARDPKFQGNVEATVRYLQNTQQEDGGFAEPGSQPDSDFTAWVTLALAAAGINPRDQTTAKQHYAAGHSAYGYLAEQAAVGLTHESAQHKIATTDFERELLVVDTAGTSSHDFGGVDLVGEILKRQITTGDNKGAFPHEAGSPPGINDTIFAILALSPVHEPAVEEAIEQATQWLEAQQKCDGSWNWMYRSRLSPCNPEARRRLPGEERGEIDMTGAALQALNAAEHLDPEGQKRAFEYLREVETPNGGFPEFSYETEPNVASTAWVVQAMWSAGINPETWLTHSGLAAEEPLGYLASMQQEDGHIRYKASGELNGMWMTAYAAPAFFGDPWPIPEAPYEEPPALPPEEPTEGNGGVSTNTGSGVIAGGGGRGAPLFSRPQPKGKGHTPGGVRQPSRKHTEEPPTHKRNPGRVRKTPAPTLATQTKVRSSSQTKVHDSSLTAGHRDGGGGRAGAPVVKGLLLGDASNASDDRALEAGAPGLRSAGAGGNEAPWLTIAIAVLLLLAVLAGMQLERRRPEAIL
jgi:prenyltransferase beta subunit